MSEKAEFVETVMDNAHEFQANKNNSKSPFQSAIELTEEKVRNEFEIKRLKKEIDSIAAETRKTVEKELAINYVLKLNASLLDIKIKFFAIGVVFGFVLILLFTVKI